MVLFGCLPSLLMGPWRKTSASLAAQGTVPLFAPGG
jgi:hypothetical protein